MVKSLFQKAFNFFSLGIMHGDKKTDGTAQVELRNQEPKAARHHGKPPALRRAAHVTA